MTFKSFDMKPFTLKYLSMLEYIHWISYPLVDYCSPMISSTK